MVKLKRRDVFRYAGLIGTGSVVWGSKALSQQSPWARLLEEYGKVRPASFSVPLPILRVLEPLRKEANADVFEMTARASSGQPLPGAATAILGFEGSWPGPTLRVTAGRTARVLVHNALDENLSLHNHGAHTGPESDGHPVDFIKPGAMKEYVYPNRQSAGTYWYHDHVMGQTGSHVYRGLAGLYIIDDPAEQSLALPSGDFDVPIVIQDRIFDATNAFSYVIDSGSIFKGFIGNTLCTNGVHTPFFEVATRRYRLRILNGSNARNLRLTLGPRRPLIQIASDGSLLAAPIPRESIDLAPSERCDCIVDFSGDAPGDQVTLKNSDATWPELPDVLRFLVKRKEADPSRVPERLSTIRRLDEKKARVRRTVRFTLNDGQWTLNGLKFDPGRIDFRPRLGTTEVWTLENTEPTQMHPFHRHTVPFQILDIDGAPPPPHLQGWKDSVAVAPSSKVRIIMEFSDYKGVFVFHCHKLEHEDHAMMMQEEIGA